MGETEGRSAPSQIRREPPRFRRVEVRRTEYLNPRMVRVTLAGADLEGLSIEEPAASVRLLLPSEGTAELVMPTWNGNEFLLADGRRPVLRTFTPHRLDPERLELDLWIVVHGGGAASSWAEEARAGDPAAISGPGRGYRFADDASAFLLAGDETAIPAIAQLLAALPGGAPVAAHIEVARSDARFPLPRPSDTTVDWHEQTPGAAPGAALFAAVAAAAVRPGTRAWAAGEAAAMQRIRRHLFEDRRLPRTHATVRGYWKHGRTGNTEERPPSTSEQP